MDKRSSYKEKLLVHASFYESFFKAPFPDGGCPILNTAIEADDTHPQLRERASEAITAWKSKIMELIKKGVDNKEFRADVPLEQTAISLIALIEGGIMIAKLTGKLNYRKLIMQSVEKAVNDLT
jgi:hypothetical protein